MTRHKYNYDYSKPKDETPIKTRSCLRCRKSFRSKVNRLCKECRRRIGLIGYADIEEINVPQYPATLLVVSDL